MFAVMLGFNGMESWSAERELTSFCSFGCWNIRRKKKQNKKKQLCLDKNNHYKNFYFQTDLLGSLYVALSNMLLPRYFKLQHCIPGVENGNWNIDNFPFLYERLWLFYILF